MTMRTVFEAVACAVADAALITAAVARTSIHSVLTRVAKYLFVMAVQKKRRDLSAAP
jgi:hypothetical protein